MSPWWFVLGVLLLLTGAVDLDWMIVAPRFNDWYYTVDYWEFCPYLKLPWWLAYVYTLLRITIGAILMGFMLNELKWISKMMEK